MRANFAKSRRQLGSTLIEALIGTLLLSIFLVGLTAAMARTLSSQRYMNTQNIALLEIRESLLSQGVAAVCSDSVTSVSIAGQPLSLTTPSCASPALAGVGVTGQFEDLPASSVAATSLSWSSESSAQSQQLIGGNGVVFFSY